MKDYYHLLGVPENAGQEDIKTAYRKLAFKYHPDVNPGNQTAEERFKEINEAYGVLGNTAKRQQYDTTRRLGFTGAGQPNFHYSQSDIFQDIFTNPATAEELARMFQQAGLRFDQDFMNRIFFSGRGTVFTFSFGQGGIRRQSFQYGNSVNPQPSPLAPPKSGFIDRLMMKSIMGITRFSIKTLFGVDMPVPVENLDEHEPLELTEPEAAAGGEKPYILKHGFKKKKLMVKVPPGVKAGTTIRLQGMGRKNRKTTGNLYLHVKIVADPEGLITS